MKKLTTSVLSLVLTASFAVANAQETPTDTTRTVQMSEVVITGALGIQKKLDQQTSAASVIKSAELTQANNQNAVQALAGKVSGLQINQSNSSVNGSFDIKLRGSRTISGSTTPLIVIDGVISSVSFYQQLPADMIESVTVLKGLQGAALYGSQGVNGAIVVTTRKGTGGNRVRVSLTSSIDFENVAFVPARQKLYGQGWYGERIHVENGAWGPAFNDPAFAGQMLPYGIPLYDVNGDGTISINGNDGNTPQEDIASSIYLRYAPLKRDGVRSFFQTGTTFTNGLTIATGNREGYASLNIQRMDREFIVMDDTSKRTSAMLKGGFDRDRWKFDGTVSLINNSTNVTPADLYSVVLHSAPEIDVRQWRNVLDNDRAYAWNMYYQNPYWNIKHYRNIVKNAQINGTASLTYRLTDNISITDNATIQYGIGDGLTRRDAYSGTAQAPTISGLTSIGALFSQYNQNTRYIYNDIMANFDYDITDALNAKLLVGFNYQDNYSKITTAGGSNLRNPGLYTVWNVVNATQPYNLNQDRINSKKNAYFAALDLAFSDFLFLNATIRNEGSSVFVNSDPNINSTYRFTYPSVGLSWNVLNSFDSMKGDLFSRFILKGSWTKVGNDPIGAFAIEDTAQLGSGWPFNNGPLSFVGQVQPTDRAIKPEFVTSKEINLGLGFLRDKVTLDVNLFQNDTDDLITRRYSSAGSGLLNLRSNQGSVRARGIEVDLGITPIRTTDIRWDTRFSFYSDRQEVVSLPEGVNEVTLYTAGNVGVYAIKGEKYPVIKGTGYLRDPQGRIIVDAATGDPQATNAFINLGYANPKYTLGFNTNFRVKNWELSAAMDFRTGHKFYAETMYRLAWGGYLEQSATFNRNEGGYVIPNSVYMDASGNYVPNTTIKSGGTSYGDLPAYYGGVYSNIAENFMLDATAFKVRELALNYHLGRDYARAIGIDGLSLGVYARNPFRVFAKENRGYADPETNVTNGSNIMGVAAQSQFPTTRVIGFNTTINF